MHPQDHLHRVVDRETFLAFVRALAADRRAEATLERERPSFPFGPGANGWHNRTVEDFLDAAVACAKQTGALLEQPSWAAFAAFLYGGKVCE